MKLIHYIVALPPGRVVLWCYLVWYLVIAGRYFDAAPSIWLNALGISALIGTALWLGVRGAVTVSGWQVFRLYLTPFCVSSFSSLIKGRGFILIVPPSLREFASAVGACAAFVLIVIAIKLLARTQQA